MSLKELHDAASAYSALTRGSWLYWAPGDATKYRVVLVQASPALDMYVHQLPPFAENIELDVLPKVARVLVVQVADGILRQDSLVLNEPDTDCNRWNPARWVDRGFPPGWWAGVRPLLAALGWTDNEYSDYEYHLTDNNVFTEEGLVT